MYWSKEKIITMVFKYYCIFEELSRFEKLEDGPKK